MIDWPYSKLQKKHYSSYKVTKVIYSYTLARYNFQIYATIYTIESVKLFNGTVWWDCFLEHTTNIRYSNNGDVCLVRFKNGTYSGQMKALTAKLTHLKYDVLMVFLDKDPWISRSVKFRYKNESGKVFFTIIRTKHSVVRADYGVCRDPLSYDPNNTMFCSYNRKVNFSSGS